MNVSSRSLKITHHCWLVLETRDSRRLCAVPFLLGVQTEDVDWFLQLARVPPEHLETTQAQPITGAVYLPVLDYAQSVQEFSRPER